MRLAIVTLCLLTAANGRAAEGIADDILALTGNQRVKVVWAHDTSSTGDHVFGDANVFELHGYDTSDDTIRVIRGTIDDYSKPLITPDGTRVVYTDRVDLKAYVINWDGTGHTLVKDVTMALELWPDPNNGKVWLYYSTKASVPVLRRLNLNNTGEDQLVWDQTELPSHNAWGSISTDGSRIGGCWPWPQCGVITPNYDGSGNGSIRYAANGYYTTGCWPSITPDNTYRFGVFDGPHRGWKVWDWGATGAYRLVDLHSAPGIDGWEIYHPVFSNHPRHVTITGPYSSGAMGANNIGAGGPQIEIYFGKVDAGFTQVTNWVQVTNDSTDRADIFPMAWIDPGTAAQVRVNSLSATPSVIAEGDTATLQWSTTDADSASINQGVGAVATSGSTTVSPTTTTTYTLTAQGPGGPATRTVTVTVWPADALHLKFNSGDGTPAVSGWDDPLPFVTVGGNTYDFSGSVDLNSQPDPAPADVYTTCVHMDHTYIFPVPNGTYRVRLHFYDQSDNHSRAMDYTIEGTRVIDNLDIVAAAGGASRALVLEFVVAVSDGNGMTIVADKDLGNDAFESGIEIISFDGSDTTDPTITITEPADASVVSGDFTVRGTANDNLALSSVSIQADGGTSETAVGTSDWSLLLRSSALGDGAHTVTATATDVAGNSASASIDIVIDTSQSITIVSPAGGEEWAAGSTQLIEWTTANLDNVTITYSLDGGATFTQLVQTIQDTDAEWGAYPWQLPDVPTDQALVSIKGYFGEAPAVSQPFRIVGEALAIEVQQPAAGDVLHGGQQTTIVWSAPHPITALVEYSIDLGETWELIDTALAQDANWGQLSWVVPNVGSHLGMVRVFASQETWGASGPFVIEPGDVPPGELNITTLVLGGLAPRGVHAIDVSGVELPVEGGEFRAQVALPTGVEAMMIDLLADDGSSRRIKIELEDTGPPVPGLDVSADELRDFLGGHDAVLVWVNSDGHLETVDLRATTVEVRELSADDQCVNPILSPDGTRVVYSRGAPGGSKQIVVRDLANGITGDVGFGDVGYWHNDGSDDFVVYAEWSGKTDNGAGAATRMQKLAGVTPDGAATDLHDRAMDAGPNGELTWLGQVYGNLWAYDITSDTEYSFERFFLLDGSVADHQTCNGSMAPDGSARLMTLVIPHDFVRIFTFDAVTDAFQQTSEIQLPAGRAEWEFPEWSTHADFFTAVLIGSDGNNRLTLVKVSEGDRVPEYLEVKSDDPRLSYSHLYVEP